VPGDDVLAAAGHSRYLASALQSEGEALREVGHGRMALGHLSRQLFLLSTCFIEASVVFSKYN
jgi:hypothetical protein